jgi:NAD(P)-dependent dehydrogenase (short-subunit alcohol dehydrogenase family)
VAAKQSADDRGRGLQRVLVTGGSSGIGLATAQRFAGGGADVALLARRGAGLETACASMSSSPGSRRALEADVTDREALRRQVGAAVAALGGLDLAVVNVGASTYGRFRDTSPEDFDRVVAVTFRSAVDTVREVLPWLEEAAGSLVVVGSLAGALPLPRMAAYTASKHALRGFVETLRVELAAERSRVTVSLVEPGPVDTPFWRNVASSDGLLPPSFRAAYRPQTVAAAVERSARRGSARTTVGRAWAPVPLLHRSLRPLSERALAALLRLFERRGKRGPGRASIWKPSGEGELTYGLREGR